MDSDGVWCAGLVSAAWDDLLLTLEAPAPPQSSQLPSQLPPSQQSLPPLQLPPPQPQSLPPQSLPSPQSSQLPPPQSSPPSQSSVAAAWEAHYSLLVEYQAVYGIPKLHVVYKGVRLGEWITIQRRYFTHNRPFMTPQRIAALEAVDGWVWDDRDRWWLMYALLREYVEEHHKLPGVHATYRGRGLGKWANNLRTCRKIKGALSQERIDALNLVTGWDWVSRNDTAWVANYRQLLAYVSERGKLPASGSLYHGKQLGRWVSRQRARGASLPPSRREALERVPGWQW